MSNNDSPLDSSKPNLEQVLSLVQNLQLAMDKQRAEFTAQKNELEAKINKLENALQEKHSEQEVAVVEARTSRRKMLRRLGAAAAGVAVASAATLSQTASPAYAYGALNFQSDATSGDGTFATPNKSNAPTYWTVVNASSTPGTAVPVLDITNATTTGTLLDGVKVTVASGVALNGASTNDVAISGTTQGTSKAAVQGLIGSTPTINNNLLSNTGAVTGSSGSASASSHGVAGFSGSTGAAGVFGASEGGPGVLGISSATYGGQFRTFSSTSSQLYVQPHPTVTGVPSWSGIPGEMFVDHTGVFYIRTSGGWALMSQVTQSLGPQLTLLPAPVRVFDSAAGVGMSTAGQVPGFNTVVPTDSSIVPYTKTFETRTVGVNGPATGVPTSATAIFGVISIYYFYAGALFGYVTLWPTGASYPKADATRGVVTIGSSPNNVVTSFFLNKINTSTGQLNVATQRDCNIIVDCYGYYS
ncbi:MAG: hypothetical protein HXX08_08300 [Chloroflexi bacterium]|uniref:Uncharacterized protein n=1 Tax=Candidatus Chlorohelix allophototropha TaxID=3003348 RepID=A0A8T7LV16_9CHLR|nr:hypothetical protein [Chloroflexota bacterium]WJW67728.1 hypothetical protein OZ401_001003 [Chloroflexota bacterium L227-S17]